MSKIEEFRIKSSRGLQVTLADYGARIVDIKLPTADGLASVVCGYETTQEYHHDCCYVGATIGPVANRIRDGKMNVAGRKIQLPLNQNGHCLHSADLGFDSQTWQAIEHTENLLKLRLATRDSLFGALVTTVTYSVAETSLRVDYECVSDIPNYVSLTNHVYWNLNTNSENIKNHEFEILAQGYAKKDIDDIPTGEIFPLVSPLNYCANEIENDSGIKDAVDLHFFAEPNNQSTALQVTARSPQSGISLSVQSTKPGFQLYSGHFLACPLRPFDGFCIEPQFVPDAINIADIDSPLTTPESPYKHTIIYQLKTA